MLSLSATTKIFLAAGATDMRKSFDTLAALVSHQLERDPLSGHLFVFCNRGRNRLKMLHWDGSGYWVFAKRLEQGTFAWPSCEGSSRELSAAELAVIIEGLDLHGATRRRWHRREKRLLHRFPHKDLTRDDGSLQSRGMKSKLVEENKILKLENERLQVERNDQQQKIERLENRVYQLIHSLYGRSSERFEHPDQGDLLDLLPENERASLAEKPAGDPATEREKIAYERRRQKKHGPKPLPDDLERIEVRVDPPQEERVCACCSENMECVDEVVTEELDIVPPQVRVKRYVQGKWRCTECMNRDVVEELPPRPIPKGRPSPSLLAYIIIAKYCDHLPLYRQEKILQRHGIEITRSTMNSWLGQISPLLQPIVEAMKRELRLRNFLQIDETPIQALDPEIKGKSRRCYVWCFGHPRGEVVYFVSDSRAGKWPKAQLEGFSGHLQSDGYKGYDKIYREGEVLHVACMAHIRRKFSESLNSHPERVGEILELIQQLFALEERAKNEELDHEQRARLRQEEARPVFDELKKKIDELAPIPTPASDLGKAVRYALNQWEAMERYLSAGEAELSNNITEQNIKSVVIGRKNYLFLGHPKAGGERVEAFYSLIVSAKRLGIEPFEYLRDVLEILPAIGVDRAAELTPSRYLAARRAAENAPA